jgi:hypothetical protein
LTTTCTSVLMTTLTNHSGNWTSGPLDVGNYSEMTLDFYFTELTASGQFQLNRLDQFGNAVTLWGANEGEDGVTSPTASENVDIGQSFSFTCTRTFGNSIRLDYITTGTFSGTISLLGKG